MDVRCDRCQTEYELDDGIVTEAGASVQCSTCGLTFFVRRGGATSPAAVGGADSFSTPETPEWTLATEDGKVHRFRDLSTLHRWIVERKVTRDDRVSRAGGSWQVVGELAELAPFFAVVEEADRARLAATAPAPTVRASSPGVAAPARTSSPGLADPASAARRPAASSADLPALDGTYELESDAPAVSHRGRNVVLLALLVVGGGAGTYLWLGRHEPTPSATVDPAGAPLPPPAPMKPPPMPAPSGAREPEAAHAAPDGVPPTARASTLPAPGTSAADAATALAGPPGAATATRARDSRSAGETPVAPPEGPALRPDGRTSAARPAAASAAPSAAVTGYDRLVADGDRALAHGAAGKAEKLYGQALALRPDGVAALTGSAYVLLGRQRHFKAIEMFRRAIAIQPSYGPALFGIAESYRARGDATQALVAYRQYLALAPAGAEASAARRQIKDLSSDDDAP